MVSIYLSLVIICSTGGGLDIEELCKNVVKLSNDIVEMTVLKKLIPPNDDNAVCKSDWKVTRKMTRSKDIPARSDLNIYIFIIFIFFSSGMINILHGIGLRFLSLGHHTPFMVCVVFSIELKQNLWLCVYFLLREMSS